MLVERTHYYAKPGRAAEVLATRRQASRGAGLARPARTAGSSRRPIHAGDGPDVTWECAFADAAAHAHDLAVRDQSPEFAAVRARMTALIDRFERLALVADGDASAETSRTRRARWCPAEVRVPSGGRTLAGIPTTSRRAPGRFPAWS